MSRPSCPDAPKPVLHSGHDDFAEVAVAQLIGHPGTRDQGRRRRAEGRRSGSTTPAWASPPTNWCRSWGCSVSEHASGAPGCPPELPGAGGLRFPRALSPAAPEGLFWKEQQ